MNYHNITTDDMLNGEGLRTVLWTAGCNHHCKNCQNPITWDPHGGIPFDADAKQEFFTKLSKDYISGVTFSGGDPLHPDNQEQITCLAREIKEKYPDKTIWLYTGFSWAYVETLPIVRYLDVVVDGEFEYVHRDTKLHWCGSSNQHIIDVQKSIREGKMILYETK